MKPAKFEYAAPRSLEEALALLAREGGEARLLAGGQSLVPMLNFRLASPSRLIDLNGVSELDYVKLEGGRVRIGAMTRQRTLEFSTVIGETVPLLREAVRLVGHLPTRTRGTIGGSLAHADPAAEIPMALLALQAAIVARGPRGEREIAIEDFFRSVLTTALAPDEILIEVRVPAMAPETSSAVEEFARRHGDFAIAAVAVALLRDRGRCLKARLAAGGVGPVPLRLRRAEEILESGALDEDAIARASGSAAAQVEPFSDQNGSADFRRRLTRVLTARALRRAVSIGGNPRE